MHRHLYFICPTDFLEPIINVSFQHCKYYFTSLGNSVIFDHDTITKVVELIRKNGITDISFVLATDNPIVSDALGNQKYAEIRNLNGLYNEIIQQKEHSIDSWQISDHQFSILSYFLNNKIRELQLELELKNLDTDQINISGQIYNKKSNAFYHIYSELICKHRFSLN